MSRLIVVGGGISGLATAFLASREARKSGIDLDVTVFESDSRPGGKMWSDRSGGFVVEHGPNGFLDNKPDALDLVKDLGAGERLFPASELAKKRFVCRRGRLERLPESPGAFLKTRILTWKGKFRVLREPFAKPPPAGVDETVGAFCARRLGDEARDYLVDPMVSGVYAGDPDNLSLAAAFPRIHELEEEYGGLFKAMKAIAREKRKRGDRGPTGAGPGGTLTSFHGGVLSLVEKLAETLGQGLVLGAEAVRLRRGPNGFEVVVAHNGGEETHAADAVVLACPAAVAAGLIESESPSLAGLLAGIEYASVTIVATAFAEADIGGPPDGFGFLVPHAEKRPILGTLWDSSVFPDRAPEGQVLLRTMVGGARAPDLAATGDTELTRVVLDQLKDLMGIEATPTRTDVIRHEKGIPQYTPGHPERVRGIDRELRDMPGLYLCHNAYRGIALNDCAREARNTAKAVIEYLGPGREVSE